MNRREKERGRRSETRDPNSDWVIREVLSDEVALG